MAVNTKLSSVSWIWIAAIILFGLLFLVNPVISLVFAALTVVIIIFRNFRVGLYCLIALSFLDLPVLGITQASRIFLIVFIITFLSFVLLNRGNLTFEFNTSAIDRWLLILLAVIILSGTYAENMEYWSQELYDFIRIMVIFFLIIQGIDTEKRLFTASRIIVFVLFVSSFYTLWILLRGGFNMTSGVILRLRGAISDPNDYAMIVCGALPLAAFFASTEKRILYKIFYTIVSISFVLFVILSRSRGGLIAIIVSSILILSVLFRGRLLPTIFSISAIGVIFYLIIPDIFFYRIIRLLDMMSGRSLADASFMERMLVIKTALSIFMQNPVFGVGANNFISHSVKFLSTSRFAHNMFAEVAADLGVLGLIPFATIMFTPFFLFPRMINSIRSAKQILFKRYIQFIRISLVGTLLAAFFLSCQTKIHLGVIIALIYVAERLSHNFKLENNT